MEIVLLLIGLIVGAIIGYLVARNQKQIPEEKSNPFDIEKINRLTSDLDSTKETIQVLRDEKNLAQQESASLRTESQILQKNINKKDDQLLSLRASHEAMIEDNSRLKQKVVNLAELSEKHKEDLSEMQEKFTKEFELLANKIFEDKTQKFTEQNHQKLGEILSPFTEKIKEFKETIHKSDELNIRERIALKEQIKHLTDLNGLMQKETQNLTRALKQDNKAQGNWGEVVLERVLEHSGLQKDREYFTQFTLKNENEVGQLRPDVLVKLPDNKCVIIDSKVSLLAYNDIINSESDTDREIALKAHITSVKSHINNLASKNYQFADDINSPDFVLLFMPIESSFSIATQADDQIFNYAWNKKIVIVSPSTLLATLRTIHSVWKQEYQNKNALKIADRAEKMHDKFVGFIEDMEKIQKGIAQADKAYETAIKKLSEGNGNLIGMVNNLKTLGIRSQKNKSIPDKFLNEE